MTISEAVTEWRSKARRMGCVSAADWFCSRVAGFHPLRVHRYTEEGRYFGHVVATDDVIVVDLTPHLDAPPDDG